MNFFPLRQICLFCHETTKEKLALCKGCKKILPWLNNNLTLPSYRAYFDKIVILFEYAFPIDRLITQLKFQHQLANASLLSHLLTLKIMQSYKNAPLPSLLIPVPLHPKRLQERGFNQALEIAKPISKILNIPIEKTACYRTRHTLAQSSLSQQNRLKNLKNAFDIKAHLSVHHVALIDDVITTGQTLKELANILRKNSVLQIDIWCCAKTSISSS